VVLGKVIEMEGGAGREVRSAVAEMLINAFTHARAARVVLSIEFGRRLVASVADDGVGLDGGVLAAGHVPGHFGMRGLRERAARLGGQVAWTAAENGGTRVVLTMPGGRAYRRRRLFRTP
jgi:Signal transduction histidine kinase, nitrate/nitrite-specific